MSTEKTFRTKTGFCHVLPDKIILTRDGVIGNLAKVTVGKGMIRILVVYGTLSLLMFYYSYNSFQKGQYFEASFQVLIGIWLCVAIISSRNNSASPVIERIKIRNVKFRKGVPGLTRSWFEVFFDDNGKTKRRMIMLPGSLIGGREATEQAIKIMTEEKLLVQ